LLANLTFGTGVASETSAGAYNLIGGGAEEARVVAILGFIASWAALVYAGWRREIGILPLTTAILAVALVFSPVLSPQFLFWLLPVSAAAFGLRAPNLILLVTVLATELMLGYYDGVDTLGSEFTLSLAVRNLLLIVYAISVLFAVFRARPAASPTRSGQPSPS
jgi:hypothetical protein